MKRRRHNRRQIADAIRAIDNGTSIDEIANQCGVTRASVLRWIRDQRDSTDELSRLRDENHRLKILIAEKDLELASAQR